jgi:predicted transcriptional regulator
MPPTLSDTDWKLMNAIWAATGTPSAREIHDAVTEDTGWAYTTVKTLLDRLVDKGALTVTMERNVARYASRLPKRRAVRAAARDLARRAFGGKMAPLVHHLLAAERLSARDRAELRRMLDAADAPGTDKDE